MAPRTARGSAHDKLERPARPRGTARDRALALLAVRWRSEDELRRRLLMAGFPPDQVEDALAGLEGAGLIDDARFAQEVVRDQSTRRQASSRAIRAALRQKGVAPAIAEAALETAETDEKQARALAESKARRMTSLAPDAAFRRLYGLLLRRGYGHTVAREACRAALASAFDGLAEPDLTDP
jgi:regulatory protein